MRYGSVCSGIEAASAAWHPLGWEPQWFSEIETFPSAVLKHHYPEVHNYGDFTKIPGNAAVIDVLVGGTPCQSFSIAGLRGGLGDDRGNLALEFCRLADRLRPRWFVWENVPGILSSNGGRDFGSILGAMGELGYGTAYRVLDAQFFGVPQRRRRVFVVGYLGDWRRAAAVLFERHSLSGDTPPRRKAGQGITGSLASRSSAGGGLGTDFDCAGGVIPILEAGARTGKSTDDIRAGSGIGEPGDPMFTLQSGKQHAIASTGQISHCLNAGGMGRIDYETETLVTAYRTTGDGAAYDHGDNTAALTTATDPSANILAFETRFARNGRGAPEEVVPPLKAQSGMTGKGDSAPCISTGSAVRRLTPLECERLQGFPDGHTAVPYRGKVAADGPRYKALGNSMAVPCMKWLGQRIQIVDGL